MCRFYPRPFARAGLPRMQREGGGSPGSTIATATEIADYAARLLWRCRARTAPSERRWPHRAALARRQRAACPHRSGARASASCLLAPALRAKLKAGAARRTAAPAPPRIPATPCAHLLEEIKNLLDDPQACAGRRRGNPARSRWTWSLTAWLRAPTSAAGWPTRSSSLFGKAATARSCSRRKHRTRRGASCRSASRWPARFAAMFSRNSPRGIFPSTTAPARARPAAGWDANCASCRNSWCPIRKNRCAKARSSRGASEEKISS